MLKEHEMYDAALKVATEAHKGQTRWGGEPYITHPIEVAKYFYEKEIDAKVVALLHDVVEDTNLTCEDLLIKGFPVNIVNSIYAITKVKGELYSEYIERVSHNYLARIVKKADISHNLMNLKKGSMKDKYMLALVYFKLYEDYVLSIDDYNSERGI